MRAALFALIFTTTSFGCASRSDPAEPAPASTASANAERPRTENEQMQDKLTEAENARGEAKTKALIEKEAADLELAKTRKIIHDKVQSDFDASARRFNGLKEKSARATGAQKQKATQVIADITKQEAAVMASIAKLRDATGPEWDGVKTEVDANMVAYDKSIGVLETRLP
jgi:hypothetical protein